LHILGARAYLLTRLDKLQNMYDWIYYTYAIAGTTGSFQRNFPEKTAKPPYSSFASKISEYVQSTLEYIFYGFLFIYIQLALLDLIKTYFVFAFASGVVLRAVPFTHAVGSFLIASAVGLYFIYPLFLTLLLLLNYDISLDLQQSDIIGIAKQENPGLYLNYYIEKTLMHQQFYGTAAAAGEQPRSSFSSLLNGIDEIKNIVQFLMLTMILYPLIAFVITYTFIHQMAELMEANVADLGRGLVRIL
jgi:nitrate reductase NapE component